MTRTSPILYWVLGLLVLSAAFGFYNGFHTATHRDTPAWAGGSTLSAGPGKVAAPGYEPPDAQPLTDSPAVAAPAAAPAEKPKPKDEAKPDGEDTTATALDEPKPVTLPSATGDKPADKPKPAAKPKPTPAPEPPAETSKPAPDAPPPAQQPAVPY
ncbi:hypothetical protein QO010_003039 [Caulobacter ginsengisoli]|uniref:Sporulation protein n=1 Tax=Caulobacter ginsengisoli TaxID=400775 RepID=A0ABU0ITC2_9CAUL|nr:hypothetical protein [Caulobacter ginsengisoli]MDQ0465252.1 hypothetical protein [Caulobacter ginsengisoli]